MSLQKEKFETEIVPQMQKELGYKNKLQVPKIKAIVINIGVGDGSQNAKLFDVAVKELGLITGQKPKIARAKKSVAGFKIRENMPIGVMVTLRGKRMDDFLTKLLCIVIPRIRDFRGINPNSFDGSGNYNFGIDNQLVFPEIVYDEVLKIRGMNITFITTAKTDREGKILLEKLGFPFKKLTTSKKSEHVKVS
ncbi:MAG: 50S ribosomal protein L5 [Cyanobacteria bacterium P01_H01_bin.74]